MLTRLLLFLNVVPLRIVSCHHACSILVIVREEEVRAPDMLTTDVDRVHSNKNRQTASYTNLLHHGIECWHNLIIMVPRHLHERGRGQFAELPRMNVTSSKK